MGVQALQLVQLQKQTFWLRTVGTLLIINFLCALSIVPLLALIAHIKP